MCKSEQEIRSYLANEILNCDLEKKVKGRSRSLIFKLIQGYGGLHDWVKLCVYQCLKSEVIALTRFCIVTWKSRSKVGQGHSSSNSSIFLYIFLLDVSRPLFCALTLG